jgi:hypothetical protein
VQKESKLHFGENELLILVESSCHAESDGIKVFAKKSRIKLLNLKKNSFEISLIYAKRSMQQ